MPSMARPPESTSRVVTVLANRPACRYEAAVASASRRTRRVWAAMKPRVVYASTWLASTPPVYWDPHTWSVTEIASNPAASAAATISPRVPANRSAPPSQFVAAICNPSFTRSPPRGWRASVRCPGGHRAERDRKDDRATHRGRCANPSRTPTPRPGCPGAGPVLEQPESGCAAKGGHRTVARPGNGWSNRAAQEPANEGQGHDNYPNREPTLRRAWRHPRAARGLLRQSALLHRRGRRCRGPAGDLPDRLTPQQQLPRWHGRRRVLQRHARTVQLLGLH